MSFLNKMMGMGTAKSGETKARINALVDSMVEDSDQYTKIAGCNLVTTKKLFKEIRTYYNYIIAYRDGDDREIVVISCLPDLSSPSDPVRCKRSECTKTGFAEKTSLFTIGHPDLWDGEISFGVIASTAWGSEVIDVSYVDEYFPFQEFFMSRFKK